MLLLAVGEVVLGMGVRVLLEAIVFVGLARVSFGGLS